MIFNFCHLKNVASWEIAAIDVKFWRSNLLKSFGVLQALMYIGSYFTIFSLCLKQAAHWGIQGGH